MTAPWLEVWEGPHQRAGQLCWWSFILLWYKSLTRDQVLDPPVSTVIEICYLVPSFFFPFYHTVFWKILWLECTPKPRALKWLNYPEVSMLLYMTNNRIITRKSAATIFLLFLCPLKVTVETYLGRVQLAIAAYNNIRLWAIIFSLCSTSPGILELVLRKEGDFSGGTFTSTLNSSMLMPTTSVTLWKGLGMQSVHGSRNQKRIWKSIPSPPFSDCFFPVSSGPFLKEPIVVVSVKPLKVPPQPCPRSSLDKAQGTLGFRSENVRKAKMWGSNSCL